MDSLAIDSMVVVVWEKEISWGANSESELSVCTAWSKVFLGRFIGWGRWGVGGGWTVRVGGLGNRGVVLESSALGCWQGWKGLLMKSSWKTNGWNGSGYVRGVVGGWRGRGGGWIGCRPTGWSTAGGWLVCSMAVVGGDHEDAV